jgi:uncharacterized protein (UPF0305 family)
MDSPEEQFYVLKMPVHPVLLHIFPGRLTVRYILYVQFCYVFY